MSRNNFQTILLRPKFEACSFLFVHRRIRFKATKLLPLSSSLVDTKRGKYRSNFDTRAQSLSLLYSAFIIVSIPVAREHRLASATTNLSTRIDGWRGGITRRVDWTFERRCVSILNPWDFMVVLVPSPSLSAQFFVHQACTRRVYICLVDIRFPCTCIRAVSSPSRQPPLGRQPTFFSLPIGYCVLISPLRPEDRGITPVTYAQRRTNGWNRTGANDVPLPLRKPYTCEIPIHTVVHTSFSLSLSLSVSSITQKKTLFPSSFHLKIVTKNEMRAGGVGRGSKWGVGNQSEKERARRIARCNRFYGAASVTHLSRRFVLLSGWIGWYTCEAR